MCVKNTHGIIIIIITFILNIMEFTTAICHNDFLLVRGLFFIASD